MKTYSAIIALPAGSTSGRRIADNFDGEFAEHENPTGTTLRARIESDLEKSALETSIRSIATDLKTILISGGK